MTVAYPYERSNSYPQDQKLEHTEPTTPLHYLDLSIAGLNEAQIKTLAQYNIKILHGNVGNVFTSTSNSKIYHFTPADKQNQKLLFKTKQEEKNRKSVENSSVPDCSRENGNIAIRNIMCSIFAKEINIGHLLPEYSLGVSNSQPGTIMNQINGDTVHQWLIDNGYVQQAAQSNPVNIQLLQTGDRPYLNPEIAKLMYKAFEKAINERNLTHSWRAIKFLDFLTGQADRGNLKNMMITTNANKQEELVAIDNDMTFPEINPKHILYPPPPPSCFSETQANALCEKFMIITGALLPKALPPLRERLERLKNLLRIKATLQPDPEGELTLMHIVNKSLDQPEHHDQPPLRTRLCQTVGRTLQSFIGCYPTIRRHPSNGSISSR